VLPPVWLNTVGVVHPSMTCGTVPGTAVCQGACAGGQLAAPGGGLTLTGVAVLLPVLLVTTAPAQCLPLPSTTL
jgi:hypothetical protein